MDGGEIKPCINALCCIMVFVWLLFFPGTVSVVYLVFLVTVKAAHLGMHLEFNWFTENEFFVPGKIVKMQW